MPADIEKSVKPAFTILRHDNGIAANLPYRDVSGVSDLVNRAEELPASGKDRIELEYVRIPVETGRKAPVVGKTPLDLANVDTKGCSGVRCHDGLLARERCACRRHGLASNAALHCRYR